MIHKLRSIPITIHEHDKWSLLKNKTFPFVYKECEHEYSVYTTNTNKATFFTLKDAYLYAHYRRNQFFGRFKFDENFVKSYWKQLNCKNDNEKMFYSLDLIYSLAYGYDGCVKAEDLKQLIDDLSEISVYTMNEIYNNKIKTEDEK